MYFRFGLVVLAAAIAAPAAVQHWSHAALAQQSQDSPKAKQKAKPRTQPLDDVEELTPAQIRRAQEAEQPNAPMPKAVKPAHKAGQPRQINCSGPFAKDSSHIRLAQVFGSANVEFTEVDGPANSKLMASVLFPRDPNRRLEFLWTSEATRSGTQVIAVNGRSGWTAPRGLKLGLQTAAVEKLNGKPFKLTAFGAEGSTVADWQGGAMASLPGGCKAGIRVVMDQRAPEDARKRVAGETELLSSDAGLRAVRASVAEILIGY